MSAKIKKEDILAAFRFRHATKEYDETKKINEEDFKYILETGRLSPSSFGFEPWKFLIIQNPEYRKQLMKIAPGAKEKLKGASHFIIILARTNVRYDSDYVIHHMKTVQKLPDSYIDVMVQGLKQFQEINWSMTENERTLFDWSSKQTYIALANMMTAAALIGIDSTPIEGFNFKDVQDFLENEGLLGKGEYKPSVMAAFGYRKTEPQQPKTRKVLSDLVQWI